MKHILLLLIGFFTMNAISAQTLSSSVIASSGGTFSNGSASLSFTVGEMATASYVKSNSILTQGFQQGTVNNGNSVIKLAGKMLNISMYPNPASSYIAFNIDNNEYAFAEIIIYNSLGVRVGKQSLTESNSSQEQIHQTENYSDGVYFAVISVKNVNSGLQEVLTQKFTILN